jgi:cephalosporin hydroxylase
MKYITQPMVIEENINTALGYVILKWQDQTGESTYFGVPAVKNPGDAWIYQEIVTSMQPDVILEIGVKHGGGALMLAHLCDLLGKGKVIGVDITLSGVHEKVKQHPRITLIEGDACENFENITNLINPNDRVLIIEDSAHTYENTLNVLNKFSPLVRVGDYFIVEDSINYEGVFPNQDFGVAKAIRDFTMQGNFVSDRTKEPYVITWNPKGFLKRIS